MALSNVLEIPTTGFNFENVARYDFPFIFKDNNIEFVL